MSNPICFFDSNIFIYSVGRDHPLKVPSVAAIKKLRNADLLCVVSTEIIQEILYRFQSIRQLPLGISLAKDVMSISSRILSVTPEDTTLAMDLLESHPRIQTRDAFHAATMINNHIKQIISADSHFDIIPGIKRIDPTHFT